MKTNTIKNAVFILLCLANIFCFGQEQPESSFFPDATTVEVLIKAKNNSGYEKMERIVNKNGFEIRFTGSFLNGMNIKEPTAYRYFFNSKDVILKEIQEQRNMTVFTITYDYKKLQRHHKTFDMTNGKMMTNTVIQYNKNKQILFEGGYNKSGGIDKTTEYTYDAQNRPTSFSRYIYPKNKKKLDEQATWKYENDKTTIIGIEYDRRGKMAAKLVTVQEKDKLPKYFRYDRNNKIIEIYTEEHLPYRKSGRPLPDKKITYYDINGNVIKKNGDK